VAVSLTVGALGALALVREAARSWSLVRGREEPIAPAPAAEGASPAPSVSPNGMRTWRGKVGPWGQFEISRIAIAPPATYLHARQCVTDPPKWVMPGFDRARVARLLEDAALADQDRARVLDATTCDATGCVVSPPSDVVEHLGAKSRAAVYAALVRFPQNEHQAYAFDWPEEHLGAWFDQLDLGARQKERVRGFVYTIGRQAHFSDMPAVCPGLSENERVNLVRGLARTHALLVRVHIPERADVETIARYWMLPSRRKGIRDLIEAIAGGGPDNDIDVVHLLPASVRMLVNTYPDPADPPRNCHWTSLNFQAPAPDDRFLNEAEVLRALRERHGPIDPRDARLGDVVLLDTDDGRTLHSMVYLADDVVFTKNGADARSPWKLATIQQVLREYSLDGALTVRYVRALPM